MKLAVESSSGAARELIECVFGDAGSFTEHYPLVFDEAHAGRLISLSHDGAVRSACALLVRDLVVGAHELRVGLIGSVSTDVAWRGRGLANRVLAEAERELTRAGCVASLLWAENPRFYERVGYRDVGIELDYVILPELGARLPRPSGVRPFELPDADALHRLYERHAARTLRSAGETRALFATAGMSVLVRERDGVPVAYGCVGRGIDFADVMHEWAGEEEDVLAVLRGHLEARTTRSVDGAMFVIATPDADLQRLATLGAPCQRGVLGMAKLLSLAHAGRLLERVEPELGARSLSTGTLQLSGPRGAIVLEASEVLELLCAARGVRAAAEHVSAAIGLDLASLPLRPFVWGLDSI